MSAEPLMRSAKEKAARARNGLKSIRGNDTSSRRHRHDRLLGGRKVDSHQFAPADGIGHAIKEEAAPPTSAASSQESEEETTPQMPRHRRHDKLLGSRKVDPHQFAAVREEEAAAA